MAIGLTFIVTLLVTITLTLLIVCIVYKIKQLKSSSVKNQGKLLSVINPSVKEPTDSTVEVKSCDNDEYNNLYEFPDGFQQPTNSTRYQHTPTATALLVNPSYETQPADDDLYQKVN